MAQPKPFRPAPGRSSLADDYQTVPRPVAALPKSFADGHEIEPHHHPRDQFIYAVAGVMRVRTEGEAWIVPPDRAVYLPAGTWWDFWTDEAHAGGRHVLAHAPLFAPNSWQRSNM